VDSLASRGSVVVTHRRYAAGNDSAARFHGIGAVSAPIAASPVELPLHHHAHGIVAVDVAAPSPGPVVSTRGCDGIAESFDFFFDPSTIASTSLAAAVIDGGGQSDALTDFGAANYGVAHWVDAVDCQLVDV